MMIMLLLAALSQSGLQWHYLLVSANLMLFGGMVSFDLISSKNELTELSQAWPQIQLNDSTANGIV